MSIPSDLLDQLLTGYLDDALTPDERARVESLLESDPQVAAQLADLRDLQSSLRSLADADSAIRLDSGFADRVLAGAVDRARTEGLSEDHPLMRLTDQPSVSPATADGIQPFRFAGLLIAVAASIAIAAVMLRPQAADDSSPLAMAEGDAHPLTTDRQPIEAPSGSDSDPSGSTANRLAEADSDLSPAPSENAQPQPESVPGGRSALAASPTPTPDPARNDLADADSVAMSKSDDTDSDRPYAMDAAKAESTVLGAILVLDVRLTAAGRMGDAIAAAMKQAGLEQSDEKAVPAELAGQFNRADSNVDSGDVAVMYVQATAKTLDRFYLELLNDRAGVESVGMSLAIDTPILRVVESIAPDPTTVRHDPTAVKISADRGGANVLVGELGQLTFAPMNRQAAGAMSSNGPDVPSQILLLVR